MAPTPAWQPLKMLWALVSFLVAVDGPSAPARPEAPDPPASTPIILVVDVGGEGGSDTDRRELSEALSLTFAERVAADVQSQASLRARVDLAVQQEQAGCDSASCFAELASALGANTVVFSRLVEIGGERVLRVEVYDDVTARTIALSTAKGASQRALIARLPELVEGLIDEAGLARRSRGKVLLAEPGFFEHPGAAQLVGGGVGVVVGVGLFIGGAALVSAGNAKVDGINAANEAWVGDPSADNLDAVAARSQGIAAGTAQGAGALLATAGVVTASIAAVAVGAGALNWLEEAPR